MSDGFSAGWAKSVRRPLCTISHDRSVRTHVEQDKGLNTSDKKSQIQDADQKKLCTQSGYNQIALFIRVEVPLQRKGPVHYEPTVKKYHYNLYFYLYSSTTSTPTSYYYTTLHYTNSYDSGALSLPLPLLLPLLLPLPSPLPPMPTLSSPPP
jgi:hypothetical protein